MPYNTEHPIRPLEWFTSRKRKIVYRTSGAWEGLVYKLQMVDPKPDGRPNCVERMERAIARDALKMFLSQKEHGFRFFEKKPAGYKLASFKI